MRGFLRIIFTVAVTSLLLWLVWQFVAAQFTVTSSPTGRTFLAGDRLLVSRMSYGQRLPFMNVVGYRRLGGGFPERGEWIAFNLPTDTTRDVDKRPVVVSKCIARHGDTVRLTRDRMLFFGQERSHGVRTLVVPAKGRRVAVNSNNAVLLCNTINLHEPCHSAVMYGDTLFVDGHAARFVTFTQNYFWVFSGNQSDMNDSRTFGFVPETHIIGRVERILYSLDAEKPFYGMFRKDRFFLKP